MRVMIIVLSCVFSLNFSDVSAQCYDGNCGMDCPSCPSGNQEDIFAMPLDRDPNNNDEQLEEVNPYTKLRSNNRNSALSK